MINQLGIAKESIGHLATAKIERAKNGDKNFNSLKKRVAGIKYSTSKNISHPIIIFPPKTLRKTQAKTDRIKRTRKNQSPLAHVVKNSGKFTSRVSL